MIDLLRTIFNEIDPVGIYFDDNVDEYDAEIKEIIKCGVDFSDEANVFAALKEIFAKYFEGVSVDSEKLGILVGKISDEAAALKH